MSSTICHSISSCGRKISQYCSIS